MFNTVLLTKINIVLVILILLITVFGCSWFGVEGFKDSDKLKKEENEVIKMLQEGFSDQKILSYLQKNREKFDDMSFENMLNHLEANAKKLGVKVPSKGSSNTPKAPVEVESANDEM